MASIDDLARCAEHHLAHFAEPTNGRAFSAYDRLGDPTTFEPVDALAPALLDAPVPGQIVTKMFSAETSAYVDLRMAICKLLDATTVTGPRFEELDLTDEEGPWNLVRTVLKLSDETPGLAAAKVTKMIHRKRPALVPIFDSKVAAFYGIPPRKPWLLWALLQEDLLKNGEWIADLSRRFATVDGRPLSPLRTMDIIIWEHQVTACPSLSSNQLGSGSS